MSLLKTDAKVLLFRDIHNTLSPGLWYMSPELDTSISSLGGGHSLQFNGETFRVKLKVNSIGIANSLYVCAIYHYGERLLTTYGKLKSHDF